MLACVMYSITSLCLLLMSFFMASRPAFKVNSLHDNSSIMMQNPLIAQVQFFNKGHILSRVSFFRH